MKRIGVDELKTIEFELLCQVDSICRLNDIEYSLAYGTLLGAVRHKGFIPWDDDIDLLMMRGQYEKFINYCTRNKTPFNLISSKECEWYNYPFAKICAPNTVIEEENTFNDGKLGVYIDVFPIDFLGRSEAEAIKNYRKTEFVRDLITASNWKKFFWSKSHSAIYEPVRLLFFLITRVANPAHLIEKLEQPFLNQKVSSDAFCGNIYSAYREREVVSHNIYDEYVEIEFENKEFSCIKNYEAYLSNLYGDYMKLPPVEKQVTHHMFNAWRID